MPHAAICWCNIYLWEENQMNVCFNAARGNCLVQSEIIYPVLFHSRFNAARGNLLVQ